MATQIENLSHDTFCHVSSHKYKTKLAVCIGQGLLQYQTSSFVTGQFREILNVFLLKNTMDDLYFINSQVF